MKISELSLKQYQIRGQAKFCIGLIFLIQFILRSLAAFLDSSLTPTSRLFTQIALIFPVIICFIIALEYFLFKKRGPSIIKYSKAVDIILLLLFMADWILMVISTLYRVQQTDSPSFKIGALYGFTSFSWRTLIITLVAQKWQIKMMAPVAVFILVTGYALHYAPGNSVFLLMRAFAQIFNLALLVYFGDKMKWKIMWISMRQEKWMEVNNFILNNIPENIMILDFKGEAKFVSNYCQGFLDKHHLSLENKDLFRKIKNLQQQKLDFNPFLSNSSVT